MRLGKHSVAPAGARLLPASPAGAEGSPSPAPSLPSLVSPSRQETSLPIPSSGPCRGGREVARGFLAPVLKPLFSVLCSRAFTPRVVPPPAPEPLRLQVPQPRSIAARGTRLLFPKSPWMRGLVPPAPRPATRWEPLCHRSASCFEHLRGHPGSGPAPTLPFVAWAYSLFFPRCRDRGALCLPRFWGAMPGQCRLCGAPPPAPLQGCWPPAGGWARGWDGGGLLSACVTCNHFCIN